MIFVFGSNKSGIHGAGAAAYAHKRLGAKWGVGEGMTGDCYALPTKGPKIEFIPLEEIKEAVDRFLKYASDHPNKDFKVTQVGCGLGGFTPADIAPLFYTHPENCHFDVKWHDYLPYGTKYWGTG
ncbi:hypothetical protein HYO99_gp50 [Roseobacter phage RD-1410W1-01]|uniref:Uncharacterized protein n=1 Tax=Roseobacter phage RD-1410W1-01 TaxID=1815984 RepID=A0A191VYJ9_9CAUD|nr:hypothetical protein HYO99_gp50 [Roseobacter phage RD-1410W1-01]ANJ20784.1 hypothetical protein RDp01_gp50 [Roseobacter phage RD-1410W1-01]